MDNNLIKVREAADLLGLSPSTVYLWVAENRLPAVHLSRRAIRFDPKAIQKFILAKTVDSQDAEQHIEKTPKSKQGVVRRHTSVKKLDELFAQAQAEVLK